MSDGGTDWTVDELNGNIVNDAIYARNRRVEDMYNIYMTEVSATLDDVRKSVLSGEDEYDIVGPRHIRPCAARDRAHDF